MKRPTVCQVLHTLEVGGAEVLAMRLVRRLSADFRFVFACLDGLGSLGAELRKEGFTVEVLGRRQGLDLRCIRNLAAFLKNESVDVIHAHQYTPFFYCRAPGWMGQRPPVLFTEHGRFFPDLPSRKRMLFNRFFLRRSDRVVAVGESVKKALINNEGIPAEKIQVIYNGVRSDQFAADSDKGQQIRQQLGIAASDPVAIQVARLDPIKDHFTALRTAERIRQRLPEFRLLIVGDGPERKNVESAIRQMNMSESVRVLGQRSDIRDLLSAADLFLLTSLSEGIPVTLIEAMNAGIPVVTTAAGGVGEVVLDGETGLIAPVGSDVALADATVRLLNDRSLHRRFADVGRERAASLFSESAMHAAYASVFQQMLGATGNMALSA